MEKNYNVSEEEVDLICNTIIKSVNGLRDVEMSIHKNLSDILSDELLEEIEGPLMDSAYQLMSLFMGEPENSEEQEKIMAQFVDYMRGNLSQDELNEIISNSIVKEILRNSISELGGKH
jgi:hypothetical protein